MRKYVVLAAAFTLHLCLGGVYAWSAFVPALRRDFGYSAARMQLVFGLTIGVLCFGAVAAGRLQDRRGPRLAACLSALMLGAGYLAAGFGGHRFPLLLLGISGLCGLSVAFGYITALATAVKWFPGRRGLAAGVVLGGYGAAAIVLSNVAEALFARGWSVLSVFKLIGLVYGPAALAAALLLALPPGQASAAAVHTFRRRSLLKDRVFWCLVVGMFCATYPGLAIIGALKPMGLWLKFAPAIATASVSTLAVGNGAGRILWGWIHDVMGSRQSVVLLLASVVVSVLCVAAGFLHPTLFLIAALILGFCYGGAMSLFPAEVAALYGVHVMGSVYPIVLAAHGVAGIIAAPLTGMGVDRTGGYWPGMALALSAGVAGLLFCAILLRRHGRTPCSPASGGG